MGAHRLGLWALTPSNRFRSSRFADRLFRLAQRMTGYVENQRFMSKVIAGHQETSA